MNRTERAYAEQLEAMRVAGLIHAWWFEGIKLRLGKGAWYTPDFVVQRDDGFVELHEVKGHWREASRVRIKVAAELYPFLFVAAQLVRLPKEQGGGSQWRSEVFTGGERVDTDSDNAQRKASALA